jgi:RNA polymerase sigma factor (sigma-70 family)
MQPAPPDRILDQIRVTVTARFLGALTDAELLERFIAQRDEVAFGALLERHAPMVLGVCRRVVSDTHLAEDVLQASFLLLARKAASIRKREALAAWLHGTALRLARRAAAEAARACRADRPAPAASPSDPLADLSGRELLQVLDEELAGLPESYRIPLLLCHLEGHTRDEAAVRLGWSAGQVKGRLERGRRLLRDRLVKRGVALPAALSAMLVSDSLLCAAVPNVLVPTLARTASAFATGAASAAIPARALCLTEGALKTMFVNRLKLLTISVLVLGLVSSGVGMWLGSRSHAEGQSPAPVAEKPKPVAQDERPPAQLQQAAARQTRENLKHIALAFHNYVDVMGALPPSAIYSADGTTPLLSWRVALLPYLDEGELYKQFKLDQPWDSPHNKKLLAKMPAVFRVPGLQARDATTTFYQVIVGNGCVFEEPRPGDAAGPGGLPGTGDAGGATPPGAAGAPATGTGGGAAPPMGGAPPGFGPPGAAGPGAPGFGVPARSGARGIRWVDILDGTSNTLLLVEGESDVPWTKPEDIPYSSAGRVPKLGGLFNDVFHVAFADGSVHAISKQIDEKVLRLMITRADGQPYDRDAVIDPITTSDPDQLRRENQRLEAEIAAAAKELADLKKRFREDSMKRDADGEKRSATKALQAEQKQLLRELEKLRLDIFMMKEQLAGVGGGPTPTAKPKD